MKWKKQQRERILHKRATERAAERTFLSPTFAAIQLKRLRKSAVLARASRYSRKVSLLRELVRRRRRDEEESEEVVLSPSCRHRSPLSSYVYLVNGNCLSANRWAEHSNGILHNRDSNKMPSYAFNIAILFQSIFQYLCFADREKLSVSRSFAYFFLCI